MRFRAEGVLGPIHVEPLIFLRVDGAIRRGTISVLERDLSAAGSTIPLYGRYYSSPGTLGTSAVRANTLMIAPATQPGRLMREAAIAHESFHAWQDLNRGTLTRADNEAVGQLVSAIYLALGGWTFHPPFGTIVGPIAWTALGTGTVGAQSMDTLRQYLIRAGYASGGFVEGNHLSIYRGNG